MLHGRAFSSPAVAAISMVLLTLLAPACGAVGSDKAGGSGTRDPVVLRVAQFAFGPLPEMRVWAEAVERASDGTLRIEFINDWRSGDVDFETGTIGDVTAGEVDAAIVSTRGLDTLGVTSLRALTAPLLIDSYELESAVFAAGIPRIMLETIRSTGVVPVGVIPGSLTRMVGTKRALTRPADFAGAVIGVQRSNIAELAVTELGGVAQPLAVAADISSVDAMPLQLGAIVGNRFWEQAEFVTTNLVPWPRPLLVVASDAAWRDLSDEHQRALIDATEASAGAALKAAQQADVEALTTICHEGMTTTTATSDDLTALRSALAPVYDELRADEPTARFLDQIEELKQQIVAPSAPVCGTAAPDKADTSTFPEGTFELTLASTQWPSSCSSDDAATRVYALTMRDGIARIDERAESSDNWENGWYGSFQVFRDRVELRDTEFSMTAWWSFDGRQLVFGDLQGAPGCGDVVIWATYPWTAVEPSTVGS